MNSETPSQKMSFDLNTHKDRETHGPSYPSVLSKTLQELGTEHAQISCQMQIVRSVQNTYELCASYPGVATCTMLDGPTMHTINDILSEPKKIPEKSGVT